MYVKEIDGNLYAVDIEEIAPRDLTKVDTEK